MFPLRDTEPSRFGYPFMTLAIVVANFMIMLIAWNITGLFRYEAEVLAANQEKFLHLYGVVPDLLLGRQAGGALSLLTSIFLHYSPIHLAFNMWALWVFGRRVEDLCGPLRFLFFYLSAGICGGLMQALVDYPSTTPSIGASGAIMGVMGAYLVLLPNARIRTLVVLKGIPVWPKIQARWVLLYFFMLDLFAGLVVAAGDSGYEVGYWAHIGGFLSCLLVLLYLRPRTFARFWSWQPLYDEGSSSGRNAALRS